MAPPFGRRQVSKHIDDCGQLLVVGADFGFKLGEFGCDIHHQLANYHESAHDMDAPFGRGFASRVRSAVW